MRKFLIVSQAAALSIVAVIGASTSASQATPCPTDAQATVTFNCVK